MYASKHSGIAKPSRRWTLRPAENLGAQLSEGRDSRVRILLNGVRAVFHRPHPHKETNRGAVAAMRRFLAEAGVRPEEQS
jgi:hypothetical protein